MKDEIQEILIALKDKKVGVFCDGSNIFHSAKSNQWKVDLGKLKSLLSKYCDLKFLNYYLVIPFKNDSSYHSTISFIDKVKNFVVIKSKDLKYIPIGGKFAKKGNMDVEIILDVVRNIKDLDVVIIVSGDSDFLELKNYVVMENKKKVIFMGYEKNMSWELRKCWHIYLEEIRELIELK